MNFCTRENIAKIDEYINAHRDEILNDLMHLVRVPSVRTAPKPNMPFGEKCAEMLDVTKALFEKHGFESKIADGYEYEVSYFGSKNAKQIGILSHTDVVPVVESDWTLGRPFEPKIIGDYMLGRGCYDDKSGVIAALYCAKIIRDLGFDFKNELVMINGSAEETGMEDMQAFGANERIPDVSIAPDAEFPCYSGEKNMMNFELVCSTPFSQIVDFSGGIAFNVILEKVCVKIKHSDELLAEIEAKADGECFTVSSDGDLITLTAKGITKHGAYPEGSINAGLLASTVLAGCDALCENDRRIMADVTKFLTKYYGEGFGIEYSDNIFGKLTSSNGIIRTTDDGAIAVTFDIRAGVDCDMNSVLEKIKSVTAHDWTVTNLDMSNGYNIADDNPARLAIEEAYGVVTGITGLRGKKCSGGTYSRALKNSISIGCVEMNGVKPFPQTLPEGHGSYHQPDELLSIEGFLAAIKIIVCYVMEIDSVL